MDEDIELMNILYSCQCNNYDMMCEVIDHLKNEKVLSKDEIKLCDDCIKDIETFGATNIKTKVTDSSQIEKYDSSEIDAKVDEFIDGRIYQEYGDIFSLPQPSNIFTKENIELFLKGYVDRICPSVDTSVFDDNDIFYHETKEIDISSACEEIDNFSLGLKRGTVTTIIGDDGFFKSLWALNIAYRAISEGKNVMYLTIGVNKEIVAKRMLTRHSNNDKFERPLSYEDMHNVKNNNLFERIFLDFQENYSYRLVVFDEYDLKIQSTRSLRRLIAEAQRHFIKENDSGIDLIIIDDLTYLSLYNGKTTVNNRNSVISGYYKFLKRFSKNMFGTGNTCSVLCTHNDIDNGVTATKNEGNYNLKMIPQPISFWSDAILTINGSTIRIEKLSKLKVVKTMFGDLMDNATSVKINYRTWFLSYDNLTDAERRVLLTFKDEEIKSLKSDVERLESENYYQREYIDEIKKKGLEEFKQDAISSENEPLPDLGYFDYDDNTSFDDSNNND